MNTNQQLVTGAGISPRKFIVEYEEGGNRLATSYDSEAAAKAFVVQLSAYGKVGTIREVTAKPVSTPPVKPKRVKPKSRSARWSDAANEAENALNALVDIQQEFQDWLDNLPENLRGSALGEKLSTVCDIDIQGALDAVSEASGADLPLGFGRD